MILMQIQIPGPAPQTLLSPTTAVKVLGASCLLQVCTIAFMKLVLFILLEFTERWNRGMANQENGLVGKLLPALQKSCWDPQELCSLHC